MTNVKPDQMLRVEYLIVGDLFMLGGVPRVITSKSFTDKDKDWMTVTFTDQDNRYASGSFTLPSRSLFEVV